MDQNIFERDVKKPVKQCKQSGTQFTCRVIRINVMDAKTVEFNRLPIYNIKTPTVCLSGIGGLLKINNVQVRIYIVFKIIFFSKKRSRQ